MQILKLIKKILPYFYLAIFLLTTVLIIIKSAENGEISASQSNNLADFLKENVVGMDKIAEKSKDFPTLVRKFIGHYGLFAANGVFAVLSAVSFIKKVNLSIIISVLLGVTISATSEIIQGFTEGRTLALTDVILNVQGHISGISLALLFVLLFKVKRSENIKQNITSFITFLGLAISSILLYFIFSEKYESVEVCTTVESFVLAIWFIIEGVYILIKYNKLKNKN